MKTVLTKSILCTTVALAVSACGGSGGGIAGIGGSGYISSGSVTGFGSIYVNGVEFETDSAEFDIEGISGTQDDLAIGMRVKVYGEINSDGVTGTATRVEFEDQLEGPISSITEDADMENKTLTVLGVSVNINAADTVFVGTGFDYTSISSNDNIQISGFYDDTGVLHATAVVKKDTFVANSTIVEIKGTISALNATSFTLTAGSATITVNTSAADTSQVEGGLANGQFVEVKGTISSKAATTISATVIEPEDDHPAEGAEVEVEGIITRYTSISDFDVDNIAVNASSAVLSPASITLAKGMKVEVEGHVSNGVLQAEEVILKEGGVDIRATASNVNTTAGTFDVTIAGQSISVSVDESTRLEDKTSPNPLTLATLNNISGNFIEIKGVENGSLSVIATRVTVESSTADDIVLEGVISSQNIGTSVTVLGVDFPVGMSTKFKKLDNTNFIDQTDFANNITLGTTVIEIQDKFPADGTADEVELEQP